MKILSDMAHTKPRGKICWQLHLKHHNIPQHETLWRKRRGIATRSTKESRGGMLASLEEKRNRKKIRRKREDRKEWSREEWTGPVSGQGQ